MHTLRMLYNRIKPIPVRAKEFPTEFDDNGTYLYGERALLALPVGSILYAAKNPDLFDKRVDGGGYTYLRPRATPRGQAAKSSDVAVRSMVGAKIAEDLAKCLGFAYEGEWDLCLGKDFTVHTIKPSVNDLGNDLSALQQHYDYSSKLQERASEQTANLRGLVSKCGGGAAFKKKLIEDITHKIRLGVTTYLTDPVWGPVATKLAKGNIMIKRPKLISTYIADHSCTGELSCTPVPGLEGGYVTYLYYRGPTMWNYGRHYVIAHKSGRYLLVNTHAYSKQTTKHIGEIVRAAGDYDVIRYQADCSSDIPELKDVLVLHEERVKGRIEYALKAAKDPSNVKGQLRTLVDLRCRPDNLLKDTFPKEVRGYIEQESGMKWDKYLKQQDDAPLLKELATYTKTGKVSSTSMLRRYIGLDKPDLKRRGVAAKFLETVMNKGPMVAALEVLPIDDGYAVQQFSKAA